METQSWFNARLLKSLRKELGWTQEDLAERCPLSTRVIAKAEANRRVSAQTVEILVRTLQAAGKAVSFGDFTCDSLSLARKLLRNYAAHGAEFVERSRELIAPDVVAYMDGDPITNPLAGTYRGVDEFDAQMRKFFAVFVRDGGTLGDPSQIKLVEHEVFAWGHEYLRVPEAPPQLPSFVLLKMHFENGLLVRFEDYYEASGMMARIESWAKLYPHADWVKHFDLKVLTNGQHWLPATNGDNKYKPGLPNIFNP
ncbi:MAG: helix-turn-helix transcriptional regulator [Bythopirellula sp.]|nr:helix-turn-helix transcriptional regulator [Bythopirellula sp.]